MKWTSIDNYCNIILSVTALLCNFGKNYYILSKIGTNWSLQNNFAVNIVKINQNGMILDVVGKV